MFQPIRRLLPALLVFAVSAFGGEVELLCTTDVHGRAEEFAALAPLLRSNPAAIRIDCGDTLQGTLFARLSDGRVMIDLLNAFGYDAWVPGNHDFEFGDAALTGAAGRFKGKTLGAEYRNETFRPAAWTLLERGKYRIAVIGMTDPKMPERLFPGSGWEFRPNREALARIMPEVLAAKPDLIVLAWHSGLYTPEGTMFRFLAEFPEIDLVLGAHSHEEAPGNRVAGAWFVQAGRYADCIAKVTAEFDDATGKLRRIRSELVRPPEHATPDPEAKRILLPYRKEYEPLAAQIIAVTKEPLKLPEKGDSSAPVCRLGAEAMRSALHTDAALFSVSALPEIAIPAEVTPAGLFKLLPYENELCTVALTRAEFEALVKETGEASRRGRSVFRFSGIEVATPKRGDWRAVGVPEKLTVAVTAYTRLASPALRGKLESGDYSRSGIFERDAVAAYLKAHPEKF
mgnify:CR=1 FL=1